MSGPWVVRRHLGTVGHDEYLGKEDEWTMFLADAAVVSSEEVARGLARLCQDQAPADDSIEAVLYDRARLGALVPQPEDCGREWLTDDAYAGGEE